jgi:hypothetical protein
VPARPSGKDGLTEGKAFGSGEGKEMKSGARREVERGGAGRGLTALRGRH